MLFYHLICHSLLNSRFCIHFNSRPASPKTFSMKFGGFWERKWKKKVSCTVFFHCQTHRWDLDLCFLSVWDSALFFFSLIYIGVYIESSLFSVFFSFFEVRPFNEFFPPSVLAFAAFSLHCLTTSVLLILAILLPFWHLFLHVSLPQACEST